MSARTENILLPSKTQQWWRNARGKRQPEEKRPVCNIHFTPTDILENNNNNKKSNGNEGRGSSFSYYVLNSNYVVGNFTCFSLVIT